MIDYTGQVFTFDGVLWIREQGAATAIASVGAGVDRIIRSVGPYGDLQTLDPTQRIHLQNANFSSEQCDGDEVVESNVFSGYSGFLGCYKDAINDRDMTSVVI